MMVQKSKKAFSMVTAIFVIIIMASITSLIMNVTGKTVKATTQQYQDEQARLLARSYTELGIMYALYYDRNALGDCLETINDTFKNYTILVELHYIGNSTVLNGCTRTLDPVVGTQGTWTANSSGFEKSLSLMIDTYISYSDPDDLLNRPITYHRRTLQKL